MPNQKIFSQHFIFVNLYQHTKNEANSSFCSAKIVNLKILHSDWPIAFWPISQEQDFSQMQDLCGNTAKNKNFITDQIQ